MFLFRYLELALLQADSYLNLSVTVVWSVVIKAVAIPLQHLLLDPGAQESRLRTQEVYTISSIVCTPILYLHLPYSTEVVVHIGRYAQEVPKVGDYT
jgi:hypothetical protein